MKQLNEYSYGYPTSITNSQAQEYQGALGPFDAEAVRGNDRINPTTPDGLHRINAFINYHLKRVTLNPQYDLAELRVRLNHINLDFPYDGKSQLEPVNNFEVRYGGNTTFGVTPTTDLSKGFDRGEDLPRYNLEIGMDKVDGGFKLNGKLTPLNQVAESYINSAKRNNRLKTFKSVMESSTSEKSGVAIAKGVGADNPSTQPKHTPLQQNKRKMPLTNQSKFGRS